MSAEERIKEMGIVIPPRPEPAANYIRTYQVGSLLFVAGHQPPAYLDGRKPAGKVGKDITVEEAYEAARQTGIRMLGSVRADLGSLDRVKKIVKVLGMVNGAPGFQQTAQVINGCSDFFVEVFGPEIGSHTRSAFGVADLGSNSPCEIEMILEVE